MKKKSILKLVIILILLVILIFIGFSFYKYFKSPEKQISLGANIEEVKISEDGKTAYIKLVGGITYGSITKIKFIFKDAEGREYNYETSEGAKEISVPFKRSFWDWLFGRQFEGKYNYEIKADEINLENFNSINEVSVLFEYKTETNQTIITPPLDTTKPTPTPPTTGGGGDGGDGGDGGTSGPSPCTDTCNSLGYECGIQSICSIEKNCGNCSAGYYCSSDGKCIEVGKTSQISQYNITWTFDKEYEYGQFANGDYWIVGPVTIVGIEPASLNISGIIKNGAMLDLIPQKDAPQGFDSVASGYDSSYNVARPNGNDLSVSNPLVIQPNHSLVSSISAAGGGQVQDAAVLTILGSAAPAGSFRPPWAGTDKTIKFNVSDLDYSRLASLTPVAGAPSLATVERWFERPWIDWQYALGNTHPTNNMPTYGTNMAKAIGDGALVLNLNYTNNEKQTLMIRFVQLGIDLYGVLINDQGAKVGEALWRGGGGFQTGRKLPIVFAAAVLNDPEMKNAIAKSGDYLYSGSYGPGNQPPDYYHFSEDDQTFYVRDEDIYSQPYALNYNAFTSTTGSITGNVKVTHDSDVVEGIGTNWLSISLASTKLFAVKNDIDAYMPVRPNTKLDENCMSDCFWYPDYIIKSIDSNMQLTLVKAYRGDTNQTGNAEYAISSRVWYGHGNEKYVVELDEYTNKNLGLPQWAGNHATTPAVAGLWGKSYEGVVAEALCGIVLASCVMDLKTVWNHDALFDYTDRWMEIMVGDVDRSGSQFSEDMWDTYRSNYGCIWTRDNASDIYSQGHYDCSGCLYNCLTSPYCGDGFCNGQETAESCEWDCEEIPITADYFVDSLVSDCVDYNASTRTCGNGGEKAYNTISDVTSLLQPGDVVMIREGTYRETVTLTKSGTAVSPIKIMAYPGEEPIINGAEAITNWTKCSSQVECLGNPNWQNIYYADVSFDVRQLFQNRVKLNPARFPDKGWRYPTTGGLDSFYDTNLTQPDDYFNDAITNVKVQAYWVDSIPITDYDSATKKINLSRAVLHSSITSNFGYYITAIAAEINQPGEWGYKNRRIYFWPISETLGIEAAAKNYYGVYIGSSYNEISGLKIKYLDTAVRLENANSVSLVNNSIEYAYSTGISNFVSQNCKIINNTIKYTGTDGIASINSNNLLIERNYIYATGGENFGDDVFNGMSHGMILYGNGIQVKKNVVNKISSVGILMGEVSGVDVSYNLINNSCLSLSDCGGFYTGANTSANYLHHNIIENTYGYIGGIKIYSYCDGSKDADLCTDSAGSFGIYADSPAAFWRISDNTVVNSYGSGAFFHWASDNDFSNNTIYSIKSRGGVADWFRGIDIDGQRNANTKNFNNILFLTNPTSSTMVVDCSGYDCNGSEYISSDNNYFYSPYNSKHIQYPYANFMTLAQWRTAMPGRDVQSNEISSVYVTNNLNNSGEKDSFILYNAEMKDKTFNLNEQYCDLDGNIVSNSLTLKPFTSKILLKCFCNNDGSCNNKESFSTCPRDCASGIPSLSPLAKIWNWIKSLLTRKTGNAITGNAAKWFEKRF